MVRQNSGKQRARLVLITGASAGIGAATAEVFARAGWRLALGARRTDHLDELTDRLRTNGSTIFHDHLDVADRDSIESFVERMLEKEGVPHCLVNNAGLARGIERVDEGEGTAWREMIETNLFGVLHMTRRLLPLMIERGDGHIIMLGSIAGYKAYRGGSIYCATKRALQSITEALRLETLGQGIRVSSVDPGLVETEFSLVRFSGDTERAAQVYEGLDGLTAMDVAECILFAATRPPHVNLDRILVMPTIQADPYHFHRPEQNA